MIDTTGSKRGTRKKSRASAKGASVGRVHRKVLFNASLGCTIMAVIMGVSLYLLVLSFPVIGSLVRISRGEPLWQTPLALLLVSLTVSISLLGIYACVKMRSDEPKHVRIREIALTLASLATFPGALAGFQFCESGHDN